MFRHASRVALILTAALFPVVPVAAQQPDDDGEETRRPVKLDPNDIRSALQDLSLVRDLKKLAKPSRPGLWQSYVNQPYYTPEVKAEKLLAFGQYEDAEKAFTDLLGKPGLAAADKAKYQQALLAAVLYQAHERDLQRFQELLASLPQALQESRPVVLLRVQALQSQGQVSQAQALLRKYVEAVPSLKPLDLSVLKLCNAYGQLLERQGRYAAATTTFEKVAELEKEQLPEDPAVQTEVIRAVFHHSVLTARSKDRNRYITERLKKICEMDSTYWPAYLLSAEVLLAAHNQSDGGKRIAEVLQRNPNNLQALFLSVQNAIETYNFNTAEATLDEIKDRSEAAEVNAAEGRLLLKKRTPDKAIAPLRAAIKKNPALPEAYGWLAGANLLLNNPAKAKQRLEALKVDDQPHPVVLFQTAEVLRDARQFRAAEKLYLQAEKLASWWSEPSAALAQLYLETGQEDQARAAYDRSFKIDPYNMRARNQLTLLEESMKDFARLESKGFIDADRKLPHFIIRFAPEDRILGELARDWMERIYPEVTGYFKHQPDTPTIIEFFPNHDQFSVRTTGLPWIGTVGACTGNVIAMDVPRGQAKNMMGPFDWARVLRHEFTHTVTLSMTNNRIPHWLTEAAAVTQEVSPRDWENCQLLAQNYRGGTLFTLDTLTWGFIRPKRSTDRHLAYMQSQWVYEYLVETYGHEKMLAFLRAFKDGKTEPEAFEQVYGKPVEQINKAFLAWAGKQVESWGLPTTPLRKPDELQKLIKEKPNDPEANYQYALLLAEAGKPGLTKAKEHLEKALQAEPGSIKVRELLGVVLNALGEKAKAREMLTKVVQEDPKRSLAARTLGLMAMSDKDYPAAEKWLKALQELRPGDDASYMKLAGIYLVQKQPQKAIEQFAKIQEHEQKDELIPRQLALLYRQQQRWADAEVSAYRAVRINPYNAVNHHVLAQVVLAQARTAGSEEARRALADRAARYWTYASELQPKVADFWAGLAEARAAAGDTTGASQAAKKAVEIQPSSPASKWIKAE